MARNVTLTFDDGTSHVYQNAPDDVTPDQIEQRALKDFSGKKVVKLDGGRGHAANDAGPVQIPGALPGQVAPPAPVAPPESRMTPKGSILGNAADRIEGAVRSAGQGNGLLAKITGAVETALHLGSAMTTGAFGMAGGFLESAVQGKAPEELMEKRGDQYTYTPRSEQGQAQSAAWGKVLEPGMAAMGHPEMVGMSHLGMGTLADQHVVQPAAKAVADTKTAVGNAALNSAAGMVKVNPQKLVNAGAAIDAGMEVPLHTIGDRGKIVQGAGEAMGQVPLSGSKHEANVKAFNRQVISHINPEETSKHLTPQVMDRALSAAGKTIGENMRSVEVPHSDLAPAMNDLRTGLETATTDAKSVVSGYLGQLESKVEENGGQIPGAALRELDTKLGEQLRSMGGKHPDIENRLAELQDAIRDAAEGRMTPEQATATQAARQRYAKTMSLVPAYEDIRTQGYLDPGKLMDLVAKNPLSKRLMATGNGGAWQDLAAAGELVAPGKGAMTRARLIGGSAGLGAGGVYFGTTGATAPAGAAAAGAGAGAVAAGAATAVGGVLGVANLYNRAGPKIVRKLVERDRARNAPPPEPPPPELTTEPGAGGQSGPRGGTVLPAPDDGPLGPTDLLAGPIIKSRGPGIDPLAEQPSVIGRLSARGTVLDPAPLEEKPPSRIIKSRKGEVERRALQDVPTVPGRPDVPEQMNVGAPAEVGRTAADNAAMVTDNAALAREKQGHSLAPGKEARPPVGEAKEVGTYDPRLAEIEKVRAGTESLAVLAALAKREAEVKKTMKAEDAARKRDADATDLEDAIRKTDDPELKATLRAEADKLREKIPTGEVVEGMPDLKPERVGKIPVGVSREVSAPEPITPAPRTKLPEPDVTEIAPEVVEGGEPIPKGDATEVDPVPAGQADEMLPVGDAAEMLPVGDAVEMLPTGEVIDGPPAMDRVPMPPAPKPRMIERGRPTEPPEAVAKVAKDHGLGAKDMERAKAVAAALAKDEEAVVAATTKGHTPAAFDAEIERINREPKVSDESKPIQAAESSTRPEPRGQDAATRAEQPRPDGAATARADGGKGAKAAAKPLIVRKNSEILADLNRQIDERLPDAGEGVDMPKWEEPNKTELRKWLPQAPGGAKSVEDVRQWLWGKYLDRYDEAAKRVGKTTIKSGGTTYTVVNTRDRLQALKDEINKSPAFKDRSQARPATPRGTAEPVSGTRQPKTVVADMVAEGDFENASVLAEHYGIDIKAGMDAKQKRAYQDWQDSQDLH